MLSKRDLFVPPLWPRSPHQRRVLPAHAQTSADRPGFFKAKDIAEAGFIYGLPIVMNYARHVRICRRSELGAVQGAVQSDQERGPTSSPTRTRRLSRPTATRRIRSYGWTCGRSRSSFRSRQWTRSATTRSCCATAIPTTTAISAAAPPAARPATTWSSGRTGRAQRPPGIKKVFRSSTQFSLAGYRTQLFNPDDIDERRRRSRPATRCSRFPPI